MAASAGKADLAFVNPRVLTWVMDSSGVSRADVAGRLKITVDQLSSWETPGGAYPPFAKAQAFARALRIPFGFLFLSRPPANDLPLPDFRNFDRTYKPSPNLIELLNDVLVKRDWYRDYLLAQNAESLKFAGAFSTTDSISAVADDIRDVLSLTAEYRARIRDWADHVSRLAHQAETARILVMRSSVVGNLTNRPIAPSEMQGFAVADDLAPIVFVNSADFKAAQVFTLAHELAHIWIGQSGIDNPDEMKPGRNHVEAFCNRTAAELLVPAKAFRAAWRFRSPEANLERLVREFWVSAFVILRRARELDMISTAEYLRLKDSETAKVSKGRASGGDYYRNVNVRMGNRFTDAVLGEVIRGTLTFRDGARLVGVKVPTLVKMTETK